MATINEDIRIGGAYISVFAYGDDFTTDILDVGDIHEDGAQFSLENFEQIVRSGQTLGISDLQDGIESLNIEVLAQAAKMETIALSLGLPLTEVTEDDVSDPKTKSINVGGDLQKTFYEVEIRAPQPADNTLYDRIRLYKAKFRPAFEQAWTIQNHRYVPLRITAVKDPNNSNKIFKVLSETETA